MFGTPFDSHIITKFKHLIMLCLIHIKIQNLILLSRWKVFDNFIFKIGGVEGLGYKIVKTWQDQGIQIAGHDIGS